MYKETALICVRYASDPIISASFQLHGSGRDDTSVGSKAQRILQGNAFTARLQGSIKRLIPVVAPGDPASNGARLDLSGPLVHFPSLAECSHAIHCLLHRRRRRDSRAYFRPVEVQRSPRPCREAAEWLLAGSKTVAIRG